jgi:hypothetical protein
MPTFKVDNVCYEMSSKLLSKIEQRIGSKVKARIIKHLHANLPSYSSFEHWDGTTLSVYITER